MVASQKTKLVQPFRDHILSLDLYCSGCGGHQKKVSISLKGPKIRIFAAAHFSKTNAKYNFHMCNYTTTPFFVETFVCAF